MTWTVNGSCIKCKYMDCVEVCPVDCFYEGENMLAINPDECIKKEYIQLRSWFAGDFDAQDKDEHKYKDRSGGIYIPTNKGKKFLKDVLCKDFLTDKDIKYDKRKN